MKVWKNTEKASILPVLAGLMVSISFIFVAGCTGNPPGSVELHLDGTKWTLTEYVHDGLPRQILPGTTVTLFFTDEGSIGGSAGCNSYFGSYELEGTRISIGSIGQTLMACMEPGVMEQEYLYLSLLSDVVSVTAGSDTLSFQDSRGTTILSFDRMVPHEPEPLVGTNWTLASLHTEDAVSSVISGTRSQRYLMTKVVWRALPGATVTSDPIPLKEIRFRSAN